jgi:hypothetical protein
MQVINEPDQRVLNILRNAYLADDGEVLTTSADQLQQDAFFIGYQRAVINQGAARAVLRKVMQNHVTALPMAIRAEIEAVIA